MADKITQLQKELGTIIKGKKEVTDKIIMAVLARGHVLLEDVPGVGKTTTALALCRLMGMDFNRIQFTPDVVPSDVTGFTHVRKTDGQIHLPPRRGDVQHASGGRDQPYLQQNPGSPSGSHGRGKGNGR